MVFRGYSQADAQLTINDHDEDMDIVVDDSPDRFRQPSLPISRHDSPIPSSSSTLVHDSSRPSTSKSISIFPVSLPISVPSADVGGKALWEMILALANDGSLDPGTVLGVHSDATVRNFAEDNLVDGEPSVSV